MDNKLLIEQMYARLLGRTADADGAAYWTRLLDSGAVDYSELLQTFFSSKEFVHVVLPVAQLYHAAFSRLPDSAGLAYWASQAQSGASLKDISAAIANSAEFATRYPGLFDPAATMMNMAQSHATQFSGQDYLKAFLPAGLSWGQTSGGGNTAPDVIAPQLVSSTPAGNATNASRQVIELEFNEHITRGSGDIVITNGASQVVLSNGVAVNRIVGATDTRTLEYGDSQVSVSGTTMRITFDTPLAAGARYTVLLAAGAVIDMQGNDFAGLQDSSQLSFRTSSNTDLTAPQAVRAYFLTGGVYDAGSVISLRVEFSEAVVVTGTPTLPLETGPTDGVATYVSGSGGSTLTFNYTVKAGDTTTDLDLLDTTSLKDALAGHISDKAGNVLTAAHVTFTNLTYGGFGYGSQIIELDTAGPSAPTILSLAAASDTGEEDDHTTNLVQPSITGTGAEVGSTIKLYQLIDNGDDVLLGSAAANGNGSWTVQTTTLAGSNTPYVVYAVVTDAAGNTSLSSATYSFHVDTTAYATPSAPTLATSHNSGDTNDTLTNHLNPDITGPAVDEDAVVLLYKGNGVVSESVFIKEVDAGTGGAWTIEDAGLAAGSHSIFIVTRDPAGNLSAPSSVYTFTITTGGPAAPVISAINVADDSGKFDNDGVTNYRTLRLSGTVGTDATRVYLKDGSTSLGDATISGTTWTATVTIPDTQGLHQLTAIGVDASQNETTSAAFSVTYDSLAPTTAASAPDIDPDCDTGDLDNDNITTDDLPTLSGTAPEANVKVEVRSGDNGENLIGSTWSDADGKWEIVLGGTSPFATDATYKLATYWYDLAGNRSVASSMIEYTLDRAAPESTFEPFSVDTTQLIEIPFNEKIVWESGEIVITGGASEIRLGHDDVVMNSDGRGFKLPANLLSTNKEYTIALPSTIEDLAGNPYHDGNLFLDLVAPELVSTVPDSQTNFTGALSLTFDENIAFNPNGSITLRRNTGDPDERIYDIDSGNWSISGTTITFVGLSLGFGVYHLTLDDAIMDVYGNVNTDSLTSLPLVINRPAS